ncbi:RWD-domain-containing protein, partial [Ramicandelaber brevisporus]
EEQQDEIFTLQSIYTNEFIELEVNSYIVRVDEDGPPRFSIGLRIKYTADYPNELPEYYIDTTMPDGRPFPSTSADADSDDDADTDAPSSTTVFTPTYDELNQLRSAVDQAGSDCLGMVMVFSMVEALKDGLQTVLLQRSLEAQRLHDERVAREMAIEQQKFIGTAVTKDSFLAWKAKFDKEREQKAEEERKAKGLPDPRLNKKLTGRQLFEKDASLARSDAKYIDEEQDVDIDKALFEHEDVEDDDEEEEDGGV